MPRREIVRALIEELEELEELEGGASGPEGPERAAEPAEAGERRGLDPARFVELVGLVQAIYHFEMHARLEAMKDDYTPFNPDFDGALGRPGSKQALERRARRLSEAVQQVLERGNYKLLQHSDILRAFSERSLFPVDLRVDMEFFDDFMVYARGEAICTEQVATWFGLWKQTHEVPAYDRVCLFIRCKDTAEIPGKKRRRMGVTYNPGMILIKLFRHIPKYDLEMLFPSFELHMRTVDKLLLGVPAVAAGVPVLAKLGPALMAMGVLVGVAEGRVSSAALITGLTGLVMLGTYLFTQWSRVQFQKALFMRVLSENLYFRNLDNNEGVLTRLIDDAEEEECKEALLAYYFLLRAGGELVDDILDARVEEWIARRFGLELDFDVRDALRKIQELGIGLATEVEGSWRALPIDEALDLVHRRWDDLFVQTRRDALRRGGDVEPATP